MTITAAADGSALSNPGPAGWAWYVDDEHWAAGGWPHGTNNIGELQAVLELFRATAHLDDDLLVLCDSQYVINSVTKWMPGWKRKGWRKADGKPVLNRELLAELDAAIQGRRYRFEWVKGHAGHPLNEAADVRARAAAEAYQRGTAVPTGPGFVAAGSALSAGAAAGATTAHADGPAPAEDRAPGHSPGRNGAPAADSRGHDTLFDFDEPEAQTHELVLELDTREHERLLARARAEGTSPTELLRRLI
ncbi:ribonuclease H family protein [Mycetocola reblochoni]|uniref:Ribonuclease H n=2 Tax=Mycetocola reblochoni TaxID=331618 RepID=A0A1R4IMP5_9MICO|nr:ribonuclease H [Mycetocola reblochoni]RLP67921.1 ribonuclease HI [Mycetocola reblochoni]SJN21130.1 Ribonuclease HI [Mycetocola reblochoni REB411]